MSKLSKRQLHQRMAKLKASARAEVAKTEVMHFRLDAPNIERLYECAGKEKKPVGALIRQWILERLQLEAGQLSAKASSFVEINKRLQAIEQRLRISAG